MKSELSPIYKKKKKIFWKKKNLILPQCDVTVGKIALKVILFSIVDFAYCAKFLNQKEDFSHEIRKSKAEKCISPKIRSVISRSPQNL